MDKLSNKIKKIIVNLITATRLLATFAIAPIYLTYGSLVTAGLIAFFFLTDFIDGKLARAWHVESFLGSLLDSSCDKTLAISSLLTLSTVNPLFILPLLIEAGIITVNALTVKEGGNIKANMIGKAKEWLIGLGIASGFILTSPGIEESLGKSTTENLLTASAIVPAVASGITLASYCYSLYQAYKNKQEELTIEQNLADIATQKANLQVLKSKKEILEGLIDTEFYHQHKDDPIKSLLYKPKEQ